MLVMRVGSLLSLVEIDGTTLNPEHTYTHPLDTRYKDTMLLESLCITKRLRFTKKNEPSARSETATKKAIAEVKQVCMRCEWERERACGLTSAAVYFAFDFEVNVLECQIHCEKRELKVFYVSVFFFIIIFNFFSLCSRSKFQNSRTIVSAVRRWTRRT